jgi:hypothetical protein
VGLIDRQSTQQLWRKLKRNVQATFFSNMEGALSGSAISPNKSSIKLNTRHWVKQNSYQTDLSISNKSYIHTIFSSAFELHLFDK